MTIHTVEMIVDTNTLNKFVGKGVEIHTAYKRFLGQLESVSTDHIVVSARGNYERAHYGFQTILSEPIIAIREVIPESYLSKEECETKKYTDNEEDICEDEG
jgi:rRNA-processing protein FCF1